MKNNDLHKLCRTIFLIVPLFALCSLSAQNLNYDFEQCNVGDKVAETLGEPWTTWNLNPGSAEDAVVTDEHCQGTRALKIDNGNDLVLKLGNKTSGAYHISFDMYIPEGKEGYFNILHEFAGENSVWAMEAFFKSQAHGNYISNGLNNNSFDVPYDEWFNIDIDIYLDDAMAHLEIDDQPISTWNYTNYTTLKYSSLSAMNFCPTCSDESGNGYYIDNFSFTEMGGPFVLDLVPEQESFNVVMQYDTQDTQQSYITNEGNAIGCLYYPWIDYGVGQEGGETRAMHYDSEPYYDYGNYNNNPYIELGVLFNTNYLLDSMMVGMKIEKMQYFVPYWATDGLEGPLTFRIYKRFDGTIIAEKTLDEFAFGEWNTVEFDEPIPLKGYPIFATVGFQQINGGYPISLDAGPSQLSVADLVRLNGDSWFSLNGNSMYYGGGDYGNHNIRLICNGHPLETTWVRLDYLPYGYSYNYFFLTPGQTMNFDLTFNTSELDYDEFEATLRFENTNTAIPELAIPIKLDISGVNVNEFPESKYKIYPNPATDMLYIEGQDSCYAVIYNALGEMVKMMRVNNNVIHIHDLDDGAYFICIIDSKGEKTIQKVIVSK